jgi:hypothetical protein
MSTGVCLSILLWFSSCLVLWASVSSLACAHPRVPRENVVLSEKGELTKGLLHSGEGSTSTSAPAVHVKPAFKDECIVLLKSPVYITTVLGYAAFAWVTGVWALFCPCS